jgi:hypothetical protein
VLLRELPGYKEYCQKTRYHLIPLIYWPLDNMITMDEITKELKKIWWSKK